MKNFNRENLFRLIFVITLPALALVIDELGLRTYYSIKDKSNKEYLPMYPNFYGLWEKPFNLTQDLRFVLLSKNHREAFAHPLYGINNRTGFIALTGGRWDQGK